MYKGVIRSEDRGQNTDVHRERIDVLMRPATVSPMRAHASFCLCALFVAIVLTARVAEAQPESGPCDPEPTMQTIQFGDLVLCDSNPPGDADTCTFEAFAGQRITVQAASHQATRRVPKALPPLVQPLKR